MNAELSRQFPDLFNRVEIGTVGRQVVQPEVVGVGFPPGQVQSGVVELGVVDDDHHLPVRLAALCLQVLQESPRGLAVELLGRRTDHQPAIAQAHRPEVADALAGRMLEHDGILDLRRHPQVAPRAILVEVPFIERPEVHRGIGGQRLEFFMRGLFLRVGPGDHRARLAVPELPLAQEIPALPGAQRHGQLPYVRRQRLAVPQIAGQPYLRRFAPQGRSDLGHVRRVQPGGPARLGDQHHPVEPVIVPRLVRPLDFLLEGEHHDLGIANAERFHGPSIAVPAKMRN